MPKNTHRSKARQSAAIGNAAEFRRLMRLKRKAETLHRKHVEAETHESLRALLKALGRHYDEAERLGVDFDTEPRATAVSPRPRATRRRAPRRSTHGKSTDPDEADPDPPPPPLPAVEFVPPFLTGFDAPSAEPFDEPAARDTDPADQYAEHAQQLDSLHRPPDFEARPPADVVDAWTHAKRESLALARMFRAIPTTEAAAHAHALNGCQSSFYMAPTSDGWTIPRSRSTLRRCHRRLCPVDALAAQRKQRRAIDRCADRLSAEGWNLTFITLSAPRLSIAEFWAAWKAARNQRGYRAAINGAFVGLHLSRGLNVHAHAVLASAEPIDPDLLRLWWFRACHSELDRPGDVWAEDCTTPAAAIQYSARPARALLLDDPARLPELFALVKGATLTRKTGIVAEYWDDSAEAVQTTGPAVRYGWQWDDDDAPEFGAYDLAPQ